MNEIWRPVKDYEGYYEVSNKGRIKRIGNPGRGIRLGRILKLSLDKATGYPRVGLTKNSKTEIQTVHRLVAHTFLGKCPAGMESNHKDRNKGNNFVTNLEYVTPSGNQYHSYSFGDRVTQKGEEKWGHKLTSEVVRVIRQSKLPSRKLAGIYGVNHKTILLAKHRYTWKHVEA